MALAAQGGPAVLDAYTKNGVQQPIDPSFLEVEIRDMLNVLVDGPHPIPPIVRLALGHYEYTWDVPALQPTGTYTVSWTGTDPITFETIYGTDTLEVVPPGYIGTTPYQILVRPEDYDGIRALLAVTDIDLSDDEIDLPPFLPAAVLSIQDQFTPEQWPLMFASDSMYLRLRLAAMDCTAARLAESRMRGGSIGMVRMPEQQRNWTELWQHLGAACGEWIRSLQDEFVEEEEGEGADLYNFSLLHVSGPTRARNVHYGVPVKAWWRYPPVVGVPPNWVWPTW